MKAAGATPWTRALDELEALLDAMVAAASVDDITELDLAGAALDEATLGPLPAQLAGRARGLAHRMHRVEAELTYARDTLAGELAGLSRPPRATVSPEPAHLDERV
jgi:hypothetical protein